MDPRYRKQQLAALCICVVSCVILLVNPALSQRLIDDVIIAQNPEPLIPILLIMLAAKLVPVHHGAPDGDGQPEHDL